MMQNSVRTVEHTNSLSDLTAPGRLEKDASEALIQAIKVDDDTAFRKALKENPLLLMDSSRCDICPLDLLTRYRRSNFLKIILELSVPLNQDALEAALYSACDSCGTYSHEVYNGLKQLGATGATSYSPIGIPRHPVFAAVANYTVSNHNLREILLDSPDLEELFLHFETTPLISLLNSLRIADINRFQLLLDFFNPNMLTEEGRTAVQLAREKRREDLAEMLLEKGASPDYGRISGESPAPMRTGPRWANLLSEKELTHEAQALWVKMEAFYENVLNRTHSNAATGKILEQLLQGKLRTGYEKIAHYEELVQFFRLVPASGNNLKDLIPELLEKKADPLPLCQQLYRLQSFECFAKRTSPGFDSALRTERSRRSFRLSALSQMLSESHKKPAEELFERFGIGTRRVMQSSCFITADLWSDGKVSPPGSTSQNVSALFLDNVVDRKILGFSFRLGFIEHTSQAVLPSDDEENSGKVFSPLLCIDPEIAETLAQLISGRFKEKNESCVTASIAATKTLRHLRALGTIGGHDFIHHMLYNTQNFGRNRFSFTHSRAPFHQHKRLQSLELLRQFNVPDSYMPALESHAYLLHRSIWNSIFEKSPGVKTAVLKRLCHFLENLTDLKDGLKGLTDREDKILGYLATVGMTQISLIMPLSDIEKSNVRSRRGKDMEDLIAELGIPPFELDTRSFIEAHIDLAAREAVLNRDRNVFSDPHAAVLANEKNRRQFLKLWCSNIPDNPDAFTQTKTLLAKQLRMTSADAPIIETGIRSLTRGYIVYNSYRLPWIDSIPLPAPGVGGNPADVIQALREELENHGFYQSDEFAAAYKNYKEIL